MSDGAGVTIVEMQNKIAPNLDEDMANFLENALIKKKINIIKNSTITKIDNENVILNDNTVIKSDMVIMATGVRPNTELARKAGIEIGVTKGIKVNICIYL